MGTLHLVFDYLAQAEPTVYCGDLRSSRRVISEDWPETSGRKGAVDERAGENKPSIPVDDSREQTGTIFCPLQRVSSRRLRRNARARSLITL